MRTRRGDGFARRARGEFLKAPWWLSALLLPLAAPAQAQDVPLTNTEPPSQLCRVYAVERAEGPVQDLRAGCRGRGVMLGAVTAFEAVSNDALQATLVDARLGSERRILLLSFQADGQPLVEDLSGQIVLAAGRGPMSELAGVEIDIGGFAQSGAIGVRGRREDNGGLATSGQLDLGQQIALERSRRSGAAAQN